VRFAGRDWHCLFNVTCGRHELAWIKLEGAAAAAESQAVFIGRELARHRPGIEADLAACEVEDAPRAEHA
jgi:hypothetical protein